MIKDSEEYTNIDKIYLKNKNSYFITKDEFIIILKENLKNNYNEDFIDECIRKYIIIIVKRNDENYIYKNDIPYYIELMNLNTNMCKDEVSVYGHLGNFLVNKIRISLNTYLMYSSSERNKPVPAFVRNLIYQLHMENADSSVDDELYSMELFGITVLTKSKNVCEYIEGAIYRKQILDGIKHSNFANSSAYMGSKKRIVGFVIEAIFPHIGRDSVFLDLMCGSGAVSNALTQIGTVYSSDAQEFCRLLAKVQGRGFDVFQANKLLKEIYGDYSVNLHKLQSICMEALQEEERIFHLDSSDIKVVYEEYQQFINSFELYSTTSDVSLELNHAIEKRKKNNKITPYCLFTYYYANVYFGLAQCIQLDSIRYAIDKISDNNLKEWALGTLVVVTSCISTSHAGHFAQPRRLDIDTVSSIVLTRQKSAWLEFSKRLISLGEESSKYPYEVKLIEGPWQRALKEISTYVEGSFVTYVDAPYKREEYSRYYHVLETIVKYDYPSSELKGRLRSKKKGERFATEFSTKTVWKVEDKFVELICSVLEAKAICVWSYSDNGNASIVKVLDEVKNRSECSIFIYGMPYKHQSQRKKDETLKSRLDVIEYCIVFINK